MIFKSDKNRQLMATTTFFIFLKESTLIDKMHSIRYDTLKLFKLDTLIYILHELYLSQRIVYTILSPAEEVRADKICQITNYFKVKLPLFKFNDRLRKYCKN